MSTTEKEDKSSSSSRPTSSTELMNSAIQNGNTLQDYNSIDKEQSKVASGPHGSDGISHDVAPVVSRRRCYRQKGNFLEHVVYFCALSVASYAGVIIRIYLSKLAQWNGLPLFPSLYAEIVGTTIMGFIGSHKALLATQHKAVYQSIATGLCGSITTFSSWNAEAVTTLLQVDQDPVDNSTRVIGWATTLLLGIGMPAAALLFGEHVGSLSPWSDKRLTQNAEHVRSDRFRKYVTISEGGVFVVVWILSTTLVITLLIHFSHQDFMFSILFASLGTYIRWHLSPLNAIFSKFKLGTFLVNVLGAWILGAILITITTFSQTHSENSILIQALHGVGTGFCGCLTTVSTFAVELRSLSLMGTYLYAASSIFLAQLGLVIIRGLFLWRSDY